MSHYLMKLTVFDKIAQLFPAYNNIGKRNQSCVYLFKNVFILCC